MDSCIERDRLINIVAQRLNDSQVHELVEKGRPSETIVREYVF